MSETAVCRCCLWLSLVTAAFGQFVLPQTPPKEAPKPLISPELENYFSINPGSDFVQSFLRGVIPPPNYDLPHQKIALPPLPAGVLGTGTAGGPTGGGGSPSSSSLPGLNIQRLAGDFPPVGASSPGSFALNALGINNEPSFKRTNSSSNSTSGTSRGSSIAGIPDIFPNLPRPPIPQSTSVASPGAAQATASRLAFDGPVRDSSASSLGGGLSQILSSITGSQALGGAASAGGLTSSALQNLLSGSSVNGPPNPLSVQQSTPPNPFKLSGPGALLSNALGGPLSSPTTGPSPSSGGGLINQLPAVPAPFQDENPLTAIMRSLGLNNLSPNLDLNSINQVLGFGGSQPQGSGGGVLSSVLYNALADNSIQSSNSTPDDDVRKLQRSPLADRSNAAVLQNLLSQPSSPLCNPKPQAVKKFNLEAFLGKWFQVLYSPPMSLGPCSMITYSKLSDIGNGGPGTVFNLFEYTTEGTPHGSPRISSGYAIVRDVGEMIYRTSSNPTDLNVYVLQTGPLNQQGQYEYVVLGVNCNYPVYVFARDPMDYKQKYEQKVNADLDQKGLATSWSRLLNVVAPVDYNLCNFPPTLFNVG